MESFIRQHGPPGTCSFRLGLLIIISCLIFLPFSLFAECLSASVRCCCFAALLLAFSCAVNLKAFYLDHARFPPFCKIERSKKDCLQKLVRSAWRSADSSVATSGYLYIVRVLCWSVTIIAD
ncbi:hypothetical protein J3F83DRAFT_746790 [Trichoderma novae-zelandiae]